jgi:thiol-disulfide isomerase/thioredoxin
MLGYIIKQNLMKQTFIIFLIATVFSNPSPNLKVRIGNFEEGTAYLFNTVTQKIDTVAYKNHSFSYSVKMDDPTLYHLYFKEINNMERSIYLILSKEYTEIKFDSLLVSNENPKSWAELYPNRPKFINDPNRNESFYDFQKLWVSFSDSINSLWNTNQPEINMKQRDELYKEFISESGEIISQNKSKLVSAFILEYLMNNNLLQLSEIQKYYSFLDPKVQKTVIGIRIGKEAGLKINSKAPSFELVDIKGNKYDLQILRGKKILMHFWSTTCAPCIKEIPKLSELNKKDTTMIILNVSIDKEYDSWINGITKFGMEDMINIFTYSLNNEQVIKEYFIKSIPAYYLINEKGMIIAKKQCLEEILEK